MMLAFISSFIFTVCALSTVSGQPSILGGTQISFLEPATGCYMGVLPSASAQGNLSGYVTTLGWAPAVYGTFTDLPLSANNKVSLPSFFGKMADLGAVALLTVEPKFGLSGYGTEDVQALVDMIAGYEIIGLWCIIRFAHEMNGNWYAWGQQPSSYIAAWRNFATLVKAGTRRTALLWSPNQATQYPFGQQPYSPSRGSASYTLMDTNHDGMVNMADDPFTPFWPGKEYVDWVGLSLEFFGAFNQKNTLPTPYEFYNKITGNYNGPEGDCRAIPDFYAMFSGSSSPYQKPMAISETALGFDESNAHQNGGPSEVAAKSAWWEQTFNSGGNTSTAVDLRANLPNLKMILWFDQVKTEGAFSGDSVNWAVSDNPNISSAFNNYIDQSNNAKKYWLQSADFLSATHGIYLSSSINGSESPPLPLPFFQIPSRAGRTVGWYEWIPNNFRLILLVALGAALVT